MNLNKIGFTTSFPVEVVFAANKIPIDLNNIFVMGKGSDYVEFAESIGYPRNICAWIKGMYAVAIKEKIDTLIGIVQGDCSNTHSLMETLEEEDLNIIPFSYPFDNKDISFIQKEITKLEKIFQVNHDDVIKKKIELDKIRAKLKYLDELTWKENKVTGLENHLWLVNSSDFNSNPVDFESRLDDFINEAEKRDPLENEFRVAYIGVPPIITDLYDFMLEQKSNIVFNEVQRQFSMPYLCDDIFEQYLKFTYPYSLKYRLDDIQIELKKRSIDAVISYNQAFCHRQIDQILLKKYIDIPMLIIEGDQPGKLDARTKLRIESFLDMLRY